MSHTSLTGSDESPLVAAAARTRALYAYEIRGIALQAYDEEGSRSADRIVGELLADAYGLERVPFAAEDVVIDIGAHVGLVSMYLAKRWPALRIHAFEPHPANYRNCVDNLRLNQVSNVHLSQRAVTSDRRAIVLQCLPGNTGGATAIFDMPGAERVPPVASITLDDIFGATLSPGERCRFLKLDCEGMEYEILPSPLLARVDFFAAEFHEEVLGGGDHPFATKGGAYALGQECARFFPPERLRIISCPKQD